MKIEKSGRMVQSLGDLITSNRILRYEYQSGLDITFT